MLRMLWICRDVSARVKPWRMPKQNIKDAISAYIEVECEKSIEDRSYHLPEESFIGEIAVG